MDFAGQLEAFAVMDPSNAAHAFAVASPEVLRMMSPDDVGPKALGSPASMHRVARAGSVEEQFGGRLFERIIVTPRTANLGPVLSRQQVSVGVWNSSRNVEKSMTRIDTTGPGSATFPPLVFPVTVPALVEQSVLVTLPTDGDPTIDETIIFVFPGEAGTDLIITGQRLAVFSIEADWEAGITETPQIWLTDVLKGLSDAEQRVQLRTLPRSKLKFKVLCIGRETAFLDGLLSAWHQFRFGVPFWPDKVPLLAPILPGDAAVSFAWANREFAPGGFFCIWRNALSVEVFTIASLESGGADLVGVAQNSWLADGRTWVVPLRLGRLPDKVDLVRKNQETAEAEVVFDIEVV